MKKRILVLGAGFGGLELTTLLSGSLGDTVETPPKPATSSTPWPGRSDSASCSPHLFLGVPKHRAPKVVEAARLTENDWVLVNPRTLETRFPGVYAIGDIAKTGIPKAGVFAEGAARAVASSLIASLGGRGQPELNAGAGSCYVEFGGGRVGRVDVDFFSQPSPVSSFQQPSASLCAEKERFGSSRRERWFGGATP